MSRFDEYLDRAKSLAEDAGEVAKNAVGEVSDRAKDLMDDHSKAKQLMQSAKEQTSAITLNAKEKVQGIMQDAKASKEIKLGISELELLQEYEGSILYKMELETMLNSLNSLYLLINDNRMNDESVAEEIRKVMDKVQPSADAAVQEMTEDDQAIEKAKTVAYSACNRALALVQ